MTPNPPPPPAPDAHPQELRIALVMNGGVSLAVWIGGVTQEINRLVRGDGVYGRLNALFCQRPRVDIISGTSAGGINGALLALAMSQDKPLDPLRRIWLDQGDLLALLRQPTEDDPPSLLDGAYFYAAMRDAFRRIAALPGRGLQPPEQVPIELTLTTTVLHGEVTDFPDDLGSVIRDVTHRGLLRFRRGPDLDGDPFAATDIDLKLAAAARATASFPAAFEPFYLPASGEKIVVGGEPVPCLKGHADFNDDWDAGRFVVDGGVLDNNPLESAIDAVFRQRAEGEVRRVLAYVVPDPGHIPDPPSQQAGQVPTMLRTALAALVSIPRVESVSSQLRAIAEHNRKVAQQRDTRLLVARSLDDETLAQVAASVFPGYCHRRGQAAAEYIALALVAGAARHRDASGRGVALGRRARRRVADALGNLSDVPWLPALNAATPSQALTPLSAAGDWQWGLFTLENALSVVLDLLRRTVTLVPARPGPLSDTLWPALMAARRRGYDLLAVLAGLRRKELNHWQQRGTALATQLAAGSSDAALKALLQNEVPLWIGQFDPAGAAAVPPRPPRDFSALATDIAALFLDALPLLETVLGWGPPPRAAAAYNDLSTLHALLKLPPPRPVAAIAWSRLLQLEVVHFAFGAEATREQYLELVQFSANVPTAFGGPDRLEQKLAGVQAAHFGAFYKRSWRINDWMFGRLDGAERLVRVVLDPARLCRLYGDEAAAGAVEAVLGRLHGVVLDGVDRADDLRLLQAMWDERADAIGRELAFLDTLGEVPDSLPECAALVRARLHLDILRQEIPALADAVGDDELDGTDPGSYGPKFLKRFRNALCGDDGRGGRCRDERGRVRVPDLPSAQLVALFQDARVGEEKLLDEVGTDRFTLIATRSAAVAVSALAGKGAGLRWLRAVFATVRTPLVMLDLLVRALLKRGRARVFVSLYAMAMAASATVLLGNALVEAQWPAPVTKVAGFILAAGTFVLLRRYPRLLIGLALLGLLVWLGLPVLVRCLG